jgi:ribosome-associated protein
LTSEDPEEILDEEVLEAEEDDEEGRDREAPIPNLDYERLARVGAEAAEEKKASKVTIMHLGATSPVCDYFVLASGKTRIQTRAIANAIDEKLKDVPVRRHRQGYHAGNWILLDYGGVVFHVFLEREREYYDLEGLWSKSPVIYVSEPEPD